MKIVNAFILAVVVVGLMYAAVQLKGGDVVYEKIENLEVETPVEVPKWQQDEDAIKAAQDVIRKKELQAEIIKLEEDKANLKSQVVDVEKQIVEKQKELGTY